VVVVPSLLNRVLPGDLAAYFAGPVATREAMEQIRAEVASDCG
jgi:peptide/nickel transport system permease protein